MSKILLEISNLKKYFGDRLILDIEQLTVYSGDKIGLVGLNGAGKTTLLKIIYGDCQADEGTITKIGEIGYINQLEAPEAADEFLSGGEKTWLKIQQAMEAEPHLLLADEPASNLSLSHIQALRKKLTYYKGSFILISHDRQLLNSVCGKIIEIEKGRLTTYSGNYDFYRRQKELEEAQAWEKYESYIGEKERLESRVRQIKQKSAGTKLPRRMGNSEARLHINSVKESAKKVSQNVKMIESRLNKLEEVKKPVIASHTRIDVPAGCNLYAKTAVEVSKLSKAFGGNILFSDVSMRIPTGSKTAMIGENGCGKTTLVKMILDKAPGVRQAEGLRIAYFSQDMDIVDMNKTIYDNVAGESSRSQEDIRAVLARLLFRREEVFKKAGVLSGGELVKLSLAKLFCKDVNMLILDEPNNYLDIYSLEALDGMIRDYSGTILIVTHDESLISLANRLLIFKNKSLITFEGSYSEYLEKQEAEKAKKEQKLDSNLRIQLENRRALLSGKLAFPGKGDDLEDIQREYMEISKLLRK